ncbi:MAG: hypothetical protein RL220_602 [Bacteroidota bacterium]|jgi:molybdopterin converting factor small subunit
MAKIIIPTPLRKFTSNLPSVQVEGSTLQEAIAGLVSHQPAVKNHLLDEGGQLRPFIRIFLGDEDVSDKFSSGEVVSEKDVISIVPAIAGGSN